MQQCMQATSWMRTKNSMTAPPGISSGNPSGQCSSTLARKRGPIDSQDDMTELTAAIAQAKAENDE